jgi:hypothetical protein
MTRAGAASARPDGTERPLPWLDSRRDYAAMGILMRLTGLPGATVWVVPKWTDVDHPSLRHLRALSRGGGFILCAPELEDGELERFPQIRNLLSPRQRVSPDHVATLTRYLSVPEMALPAPVYPWAVLATARDQVP